MKIEKVESMTVHFVKTDEKDYREYKRYSPESWTVAMGESDEQVYDCAELEAAFQAFIKTLPDPFPCDECCHKT